MLIGVPKILSSPILIYCRIGLKPLVLDYAGNAITS